MMRFTVAQLHEKAKERPEGYVADVLSCATVNGDVVEMHGRDYARMLAKYRVKEPINLTITRIPMPPHPDGAVGTELKKLLATIGITAQPNCSCNKRAKMMDAAGPDWCEQNIATIVGWMRQEATRRGLPFIDTAGKALVRLAISRARRTAKSS